MKAAAPCFLGLLFCGAAALAENIPVLEAAPAGAIVAENLEVTEGDFRLSSPWWSEQFDGFGSNYQRAHIAVKGADAPAGTTIVGKDWAGSVYFEYEISGRSGETFWTGMVHGGTMFLELHGENRPDGVKLEVIEILKQQDINEQMFLPYSWHGPNQLQRFNEDLPDYVRSAARPVAWLNYVQGGKAFDCTGFMVSENLLLTNEHCVNSQEACDSLIATFGFESDRNGSIQLGEEFTCADFDAQRADFSLDAVLLRLHGAPGEKWGVATLSDLEEVPLNTDLAIIQHPQGRGKEVSLKDCKAVELVSGRAAGTDFTHECDTEWGSSGAPVFDETGAVVGLHHFGFNDKPGSDWTRNRGVRLSHLRLWLEAQLAADIDTPQVQQ